MQLLAILRGIKITLDTCPDVQPSYILPHMNQLSICSSFERVTFNGDVKQSQPASIISRSDKEYGWHAKMISANCWIVQRWKWKQHDNNNVSATHFYFHFAGADTHTHTHSSLASTHTIQCHFLHLLCWFIVFIAQYINETRRPKPAGIVCSLPYIFSAEILLPKKRKQL